MSSHANQICNIIPEERYHCEDERNLFFFVKSNVGSDLQIHKSVRNFRCEIRGLPNGLQLKSDPDSIYQSVLGNCMSVHYINKNITVDKRKKPQDKNTFSNFNKFK